MPVFEGIEVSIVTRSEIGQLPEYPYPDSSADKLRNGRLAPLKDGMQDGVECDEADPFAAESMVSVYVPSLPGAQFIIKYAVHQAPSATCHLFFKLYMNGRHITSWGINPNVKSHGCTEKALYEPSDRWSHEENGVVFKRQGIEARYFYFTNNQQDLSAAADGGLIEVRVFRAKGRRRRAAKLDQYRHQDEYGISAPSGGLLDNPQDVTYFDFHLLDPKDAPFARFRFHYRSWTNLNLLNLITVEDMSILEATITSSGPVASGPLLNKSMSPVKENKLCNKPVYPDELVFDDSSSSGGHDGPSDPEARPGSRSRYGLRSPVQFTSYSSSSCNLPQPSKSLRDAVSWGIPGSYRERTLPDRPIPELPDTCPDESWLPHSRNCSTGSAAPSVATSLLSYIENEALMNETVEYGQAQEVSIRKEYPGVPLCDSRDSLTGKSTIKVIDELSDDSRESGSPGIGTEVTGLHRQPPRSPENDSAIISGQHVASPRQDALSLHGQRGRATECPSSGKTQVTRSKEDLGVSIYAEFAHLRQPQCDALKRAPSPMTSPRGVLSPRLGRLWRSLRRSKSRSPLRALRLAPNAKVPKNNSTPQFVCPEVKERHGNWI